MDVFRHLKKKALIRLQWFTSYVRMGRRMQEWVGKDIYGG
jgi:hypothetical protein